MYARYICLKLIFKNKKQREMRWKFLFIYLLLQGTFAQEPSCVCSKFHYEEQMLQKMVRMEFAMERMKVGMEEALGRVEETAEKFNRLKTEHEQYVDASRKELQDLKDYLRTPTVAFKAKKVRDQSPNIDDTIVFTEILFNYGEHYNKDSGIFTAPYDGTYLFTLQLCLITGKYIYYGIIVEDERFTNGMFYEGNTYNCNTADAIVVLKSGNRVWVKYLRDSTTGATVIEGNHDHRWNTFSGTLIHV